MEEMETDMQEPAKNYGCNATYNTNCCYDVSFVSNDCRIHHSNDIVIAKAKAAAFKTTRMARQLRKATWFGADWTKIEEEKEEEISKTKESFCNK